MPLNKPLIMINNGMALPPGVISSIRDDVKKELSLMGKRVEFIGKKS